MCYHFRDQKKCLHLLSALSAAILQLPAAGCFPTEIILLVVSILDSGELDVYIEENESAVVSMFDSLVLHVAKTLDLSQVMAAKHPDTLLNRQVTKKSYVSYCCVRTDEML